MAQQVLNGLILGSILLLFSLGLSLAWGTLDVLNLAHGSLFILGGYLGYQIGTSTSLPFVVVAILAILGSGLAAAVMELIAFGPIRRRMESRRQAELAVLVASLGASIVLNQTIANRVDNAIFSPPASLLPIHRFEFWGIRVTNVQVTILAVTLVASVVLAVWINRSREGRATRAVACDPQIAELMGIWVRALRLRVMFLSGALAGLAGFLMAFQISGEDAQTGSTYMVSAFAILILGGVGSLSGAAMAAYVIAMAETMLVAYGPSEYSTGVAFFLIFVTLLFRPEGLVSRGKSVRV
jgi:branched-chain amino acid transport system permease protein